MIRRPTAYRPVSLTAEKARGEARSFRERLCIRANATRPGCTPPESGGTEGPCRELRRRYIITKMQSISSAGYAAAKRRTRMSRFDTVVVEAIAPPSLVDALELWPTRLAEVTDNIGKRQWLEACAAHAPDICFTRRCGAIPQKSGGENRNYG
jgi:hypothetical protein